jgi:chromosome segregation ATPase
MNLKQVEISGFKSFAKKSVLDFKTSITAIVGPNGSGKSNVAEAFSFVLGEQSIKSLRGKKGEDLIYNGSASGTRSNRASVKVIFDNKKRLLDIDFDEVSVERQVHRDGINQYLINGSTVRLKDVIELLSGANIGSTGHHIISQGEADRILTDNPRERKAVIEDALGLRIYQIKRRDSEKKLEKTEENVKQINSLRKEISPHLNFLKKQAEKIEKTLEMRKDLVEMYKEYFKIEDTYIKSQKEKIEEESREPKGRLKELEEKIGKLEKEAGKGRDTKEESSVLHGVEKQINDLRQEKGKLILELGRFEGELKSLKKILGSKPEVKESQISLNKVEDLIRSVESKIESLKEEHQIPKFRSVLMEIRESFKGFLSSVSGPKVSVNYDSEIRAVEKQITEAEGKIESLIKEEDKLKEKFEDLAKEIEENKDTGIKAEREMFDLKEEKNEIVMKLRELQVLKDRLEDEEGDYKRELTSAAVLAGREAINFNTSPHVGHGEKDREEQEKRRREIEKIKIRLEDAGGASGEEIMTEYKEVKERDEFLEKEIEDLKASATSLTSLIKDLEEKLEKEFGVGLDKINNQFQEFFSLMFGGGTASLNVVKDNRTKKSDDDEDFGASEEAPEEEQTSDGVTIEVNLPRKKIKGLMMLSGGERALTSIALLFAMSQVNPPPFIILDETDAALDEANSRKYGDMITNLSKHSQLILITHNRETMSRAGVLYGVTMDNTGVSKLLSVDLQEAVEVAK